MHRTDLVAAEEYKHERLSKRESQRLLGIETSFQLDEFLTAHDIWIEYTRRASEPRTPAAIALVYVGEITGRAKADWQSAASWQLAPRCRLGVSRYFVDTSLF
jgi:hypothetical protein